MNSQLLIVSAALILGFVPAQSSAENPKTQTAAATPGSTPGAGAGLLDADFSKEATYIKADNLTLKSNERFFVYTGSVEVRQGDLTLTSSTLEGNYTEKNKIKDLLAKGNVLVTKGEDIRATGERATYDAASEVVVLTENPELQQGESVLTADVVRIFLKENRSAAEGQVRVKLVKKGEKGNLMEDVSKGMR